MTYQITTLHYAQHALEAFEIEGQKWLRVEQLVPPLGLGSTRAVRIIFERNEEEFTTEETRLVTVPTLGGEQQLRLFSLRGARLLALFAKTPQAKAFRRWVLDLMEGRTRVGPRTPIAPLPTETQVMLRELQALPDELRAQAIDGYLRGDRSIPEVGPLTALRRERNAIVAVMAEQNRSLRSLYQRARRLGYSPETLKWQPPVQQALPWDGGSDLLGDGTNAV